LPGRYLLVLAIFLLTASAVTAQTTQPSKPPTQPSRPTKTRDEQKPSSASAVNIAITQLTQEVKEAAKEGRLPRSKADFAASFTHEIPSDAVVRKIIRPISRDPRVDGYVRWQLTSFRPSIAELEPRQYQQMLRQLPALQENPRANDELLRMVQAMRRVNPLDETQKKAISDRLDSLSTYVSRTRDFNVPAIRFREWMSKQYEKNRARSLELAMERVAAHVKAGWSIDRLKTPLEAMFEAARWDDEFTDDQRRRIAKLAMELVGRRRVVLGSARVNQDQLEVEFDETAVYDFDVRRWIKLLERK
jgi:hypothetical protein